MELKKRLVSSTWDHPRKSGIKTGPENEDLLARNSQFLTNKKQKLVAAAPLCHYLTTILFMQDCYYSYQIVLTISCLHVCFKRIENVKLVNMKWISTSRKMNCKLKHPKCKSPKLFSTNMMIKKFWILEHFKISNLLMIDVQPAKSMQYENLILNISLKECSTYM